MNRLNTAAPIGGSWPVARGPWQVLLDSVGIGAMPDAAEYGDAGSDTLGAGRMTWLNTAARKPATGHEPRATSLQ